MQSSILRKRDFTLTLLLRKEYEISVTLQFTPPQALLLYAKHEPDLKTPFIESTQRRLNKIFPHL